MSPYTQTEILESFRHKTGSSAELLSRAPGRFNVIGEHTDYNSGLSLPAATEQEIIVAFAKSNKNEVLIFSENFHDAILFRVGEDFQPASSWQRFAYGCWEIFRRKTGVQKGFTALIYGKLPWGFGLSSSAALCVSLLNGLSGLFDIPLEGMEICQMAQQAEQEFAGNPCGLMDQMASYYSESQHYLLIDFQDLSHRTIHSRMEGMSWILLNSGVRRELAGAGYGDRVSECRMALKLIQKKYPTVKTLRECNSLHRLSLLDEDQVRLYERTLHVFLENKRVRKAVDALSKGDAARLGEILNDSHYSLREFYQVSCPELDFLQEESMKISSCLGSRMMGGGFGGCTLNLVEADAGNHFIQELSHLYEKKYNKKLSPLVVKPSAGAEIINLSIPPL